jgi:hypothetical protein
MALLTFFSGKKFDEVLAKGIRAGQVPARSKVSRDWYRNTAKSINFINERSLLNSDKSRLTTTLVPGTMYMFFYDPKHKKTLPFYDRFPLIFPFELTSDGFMGINLHYLPLDIRAKVMDALYTVATDRKYNETTRLRLSYGVLQQFAGSKFIRPCIKRYLNGHVKSAFMQVFPAEWDIALFLPTERFAKASKQQVFEHSRKMIKGTKR